jgi:glycosyltransferase involved in cell wall biosynthesis
MWEQLVLPGLIRQSRANVLFAPAYTAPLTSPVPVVLTVHDVSFVAHPEWFSWREGVRRRVMTKASARRAARVLTQSDFTKREAVRYLGLDQSRVDVIYLGTTTLRTQATREPLVLYVGSLFNRRHIPELIEGFSQLAATHPTARLEIVGDNRTLPAIDVDALIARSCARDRIRARHYVSDAELSALYARASVFAFLSEYEGLGSHHSRRWRAESRWSCSRRRSHGKSTARRLSTSRSPEPSMIATALERVLVDQTVRHRLVEAGRAQVERYSWDECARRTLQVLLACAK